MTKTTESEVRARAEKAAEDDCKKLWEMIELQCAYDEACFKANGIEFGYMDIRVNLDDCLTDEIGELNHELKPVWCHWGRHAKTVDRKAALEELADVTHFLLAKVIANHLEDRFVDCFKHYRMTFSQYQAGSKYFNLSALGVATTPNFMALGFLKAMSKAGFDFDDLYKAYKRKNKENYKRLKEQKNG